MVTNNSPIENSKKSLWSKTDYPFTKIAHNNTPIDTFILSVTQLVHKDSVFVLISSWSLSRLLNDSLLLGMILVRHDPSTTWRIKKFPDVET